MVMAILALVGGLVAININKALKEQRFRSEVSQIVDQMRLAQDLMLILDTDVSLKFFEDEGKIKYFLDFEYPLTKAWLKEIKKPHFTKMMRRIEFNDELPYPTRPREISIKFFSKGSIMSRGVVRLTTAPSDDAPEGMEKYICLLGHPQPIFPMADKPEELEAMLTVDKDFDERLTQLTRQEILEYASEKK